jgi:hypothetical protein
MAAALVLGAFFLTGCRAQTPSGSSNLSEDGGKTLTMALKTGEDRVDSFADKPEMLPWQLRLRLHAMADFQAVAEGALKSAALPEARRDALRAKLADLQSGERIYRGELAQASARHTDLLALAGRLSADFHCRVRIYDEGEQRTFFREVSEPECDPVAAGDFQRAVTNLNALAETALPGESEAFRREAARLNETGEVVAELNHLRQRLFELGVVREEEPGGQLRIAHIGHPFERADHSALLRAYGAGVRALARALALHGTAEEICPAPICDARLFEVAEVLDHESGGGVADPYGLSSFSQRYGADVRLWAALGFDSRDTWIGRPELYECALDRDGVLAFARIFPGENLIVSVAGWASRPQERPVLPLYYIFHEAGVLFEEVRAMGLTDVREIRFAPSDSGGSLVSFDDTPIGRRLTVRALDFEDGRSAAQVREDILGQLRSHFQMADNAKR